MNRIFFLRHGENVANITKELSYKLIDYNLTEKGVIQAKQTAEYFRGKNIDFIYSSPLQRALETSNIIAKEIGINTETVEDFREINVGDLEETTQDQNSWETFFNIINYWLTGNREICFPNGESLNNLYQRFYRGLQHVVNNKKDKNIIIVGHGGIFTIGIMELCSIQNRMEFAYRNKDYANCSITELLVEENGNSLSGKLLRWADHSHLSGEAANFVSGLPSSVMPT